MLIYNDLKWQTRSDFPDSDWTDGENTKYVIPDGSELANIAKINNLQDMDFAEENGVLISITPKIEILKTNKIAEMSNNCYTTIIGGVDFNGEHYSLDSTDQTNITNLFVLANNPTTADKLAYHADGQKCRKYTADEIIGLYGVMFSFVSYNTTYNNLLKNDIEDMTDKEIINDVYYGYPLSADNQELFNELMNVNI